MRKMSSLETHSSLRDVLDVSLICLIVILVVYLILLLYYIFVLCMVSVKLGKPPESSFQIVYRYAYQGRSSSKLFYKMLCTFPSCRGIKLCYTGPKASYIEYAYGLILHDDKSSNTYQIIKEYLCRNIFNVFQTPEIPHALYMVFPVVPWLPKYIAHWLAIAVGYIKISNSSQKYNLCGYPVLEIYGKKQLSFIVPLMRQDDFIVWEAERIVFGRHFSAMLRPLTLFTKNVDTEVVAVPPTNKSPRKINGKKKRG